MCAGLGPPSASRVVYDVACRASAVIKNTHGGRLRIDSGDVVQRGAVCSLKVFCCVCSLSCLI